MNRVYFILITTIFISCNEGIQFCEHHTSVEKDILKQMLSSKVNKELLPLSAHDEVIQYHGSDSWGWFDHTIRLTVNKDKYLLQLLDSRKDPKTKVKNTIYRELILDEAQKESIFKMIELLQCKPVQLESGIGVDGDFYNLIIKKNSKLQGYKWQTINIKNDSQDIKILKREVVRLVGAMMNLCKFPNGLKIIIPRLKTENSDSIQYDVFLTNQYNLIDYDVFFDNNKMKKDRDRIARFKVHKKDTLNINQRVKVKAVLFDGEKIEM